MDENPQNNQPNQPKPNGGKKPLNYFLLLQLGIEFAVLIAAPLIAFIFAGRWLDNKYHTKFIVIIGILSAIALSSYMISRKVKEVLKLIK